MIPNKLFVPQKTLQEKIEQIESERDSVHKLVNGTWNRYKKLMEESGNPSRYKNIYDILMDFKLK